ncbi:MAG: hypothetical protein ACNI25_16540 [Halarcobacter sp.]
MNLDETYDQALELYNKGRFEDSIKICNKIVDIDQNHPHTWNLLGNIFFKQNDLDSAKNFFITAINQKEDFVEAYYMLGNTLFTANFFHEAIGIWQEGLKHEQVAIIYSNIAAAFIKLEDTNNALLNAQKALEIDDRCEDAYNCILSIAKKQNDLETIENFSKILLMLNPENAIANTDYAYTLLKKGDFKNGFKHFEYRKKLDTQKGKYAYMPFQEYKNENLEDKNLLIYHEQGFGDNIQFARFLKDIPCKNISYGIQNSLNKLFSYNFPNIKFLKEISSTDSFDYSIASMSIPYSFNINKIDAKSYLTVDKKDIENFKEKNILKGFKNIGIVWKGSQTSEFANKKSLELNNFELLFNYENRKFHSLQIDNKEDLVNYNNISDLGKEFKSFYDTAVAISSLDLVISVDTAVAHLCGALGKKGIVLNNNMQFDFRWEQINQKSIWYESLTILKYDDINKCINQLNRLIDEL